MKRFGLHPDDAIKISGTTKTHLVCGESNAFVTPSEADMFHRSARR